MEKYLGVKLISAEPMDKQTAFKHGLLRIDILEGNQDGYNVIYEDGLISWLPKEEFEKTYRTINGLTFGLAIEALKQGKKVARAGWNGKGMYLKLIRSYPVNGHLNPALAGDEPICQTTALPDFSVDPTTPDGSENITQGNPGQMLSHIVMKTAGQSLYWGIGYSDYVPWLASQTDMLAEDWMIVE